MLKITRSGGWKLWQLAHLGNKMNCLLCLNIWHMPSGETLLPLSFSMYAFAAVCNLDQHFRELPEIGSCSLRCREFRSVLWHLLFLSLSAVSF